MGNTPCGQITTSYKVPLNAVNKEYNNFSLIQYQELFHYPARYPYILSYLRKNNILFEDMYFPANETKQIIGVNLVKELGFPIIWKRVNNLAYRRNIRFGQTLFHQQPQRYKEPHAMYRLLLWITSMPQLMKKMFLFQTLNQEGLVLVYLPINGSHDQPVEIVIDDDIPMREENEYYCPLPQGNNVAMILLEKALAKVTGSYEKARSLPIKDIFQILIGLPINLETLGNRDVMPTLERYYKPHYYIVSHNKKLQNHQPQYFKFAINIDSQVSISIWQLLENPHSFEMSTPGTIVMELMRIESETKVVRVAYSSKLYKDKTFLRTLTPEEEKTMSMSREFLNLPRGNYLLHIYTKTENVSVNSNLIVYSSSPISLTYRKENYELNTYKKKMVQDVFLQKNKQLDKCMFTERVYSKFIWDGFRGILAFKSEEPVRIKINILIKTQYRRKIKFEHSQQYEETLFLKPQSKKILSFVKFVETDVGNFYEQDISYVKKDLEIQNFTPSVNQNNIHGQSVNPNYPPRIDISSSPFREMHQFDTYREEDSMMSESKEFINMNPNKNFKPYR